jgi:hypothetical protein
VLCQDTQGNVARDRLLVAWPNRPVELFPLAAAAVSLVQGDFVLCGKAGRAWEAATAALQLPHPVKMADMPGSYAVGLLSAGGRQVLYALAADRTSFLAALESLIERTTWTPEGLLFSGEPVQVAPALRYRLLWTWDHSTNWALGYPGQVDLGVNHAYLKPPEAFLDDYTRLVDWASRHRLNGVIIWGLLRDAHRGVAAAQELCTFANARGVRVLAGVGASFYGGPYYEGNHPFNVDRWLQKHPSFAARDRQGRAMNRLCPSEPANQAWLREGVHWLFETLDLGGVNLEVGDFMVCTCPRCRALRAKLGSDDPAFLQEMQIALVPIVEEIRRLRPDAWITFGAYTGFYPGPLPHDMGEPDPNVVVNLANMGSAHPMLVRAMPVEAVFQWSLTAMVRQEPVSLLGLLDDGAPPELLSTSGWPPDLRPPARHNIGLLHQGSQWYSRGHGDTRYQVEIATIKEACLHGYRVGLEGLAITGEASPSYTACELNYLALAHFSYRPEDSLRAFARTTLAPFLGGVDDAEAFITWLAKRQAGCMTITDEAKLHERVRAMADAAARGGDWNHFRRWRWLGAYRTGQVVDGTGSLLTAN